MGDEHLEPLEIDPGIVEQRLIALELALELGELRLEWARVDLRQQISAADDLPFLEPDRDQLAVNPGLHRDGIEGSDRPSPLRKRPCRASSPARPPPARAAGPGRLPARRRSTPRARTGPGSPHRPPRSAGDRPIA